LNHAGRSRRTGRQAKAAQASCGLAGPGTGGVDGRIVAAGPTAGKGEEVQRGVQRGDRRERGWGDARNPRQKQDETAEAAEVAEEELVKKTSCSVCAMQRQGNSRQARACASEGGSCGAGACLPAGAGRSRLLLQEPGGRRDARTTRRATVPMYIGMALQSGRDGARPSSEGGTCPPRRGRAQKIPAIFLLTNAKAVLGYCQDWPERLWFAHRAAGPRDRDTETPRDRGAVRP